MMAIVIVARARRPAHSRRQAGVARQIAVGVVIGRTSEYFDFFVYGIASVLVFPQLIFPFAPDRLTARSIPSRSSRSPSSPGRSAPSSSWRSTAVRPRRQADDRAVPARRLHRLDRLPARLRRRSAYWSIVLLALFRIGQGIALGGAWDGLASLLALNAPANRRGWYAMIPQLGAPIGFTLASALFAYFVASLSQRGFPGLGLALSVLRRLRDQRRGAVRAAAPRRDARSSAQLLEERELEPQPVSSRCCARTAATS